MKTTTKMWLTHYKTVCIYPCLESLPGGGGGHVPLCPPAESAPGFKSYHEVNLNFKVNIRFKTSITNVVTEIKIWSNQTKKRIQETRLSPESSLNPVANSLTVPEHRMQKFCLWRETNVLYGVVSSADVLTWIILSADENTQCKTFISRYKQNFCILWAEAMSPIQTCVLVSAVSSACCCLYDAQ